MKEMQIYWFSPFTLTSILLGKVLYAVGDLVRGPKGNAVVTHWVIDFGEAQYGLLYESIEGGSHAPQHKLKLASPGTRIQNVLLGRFFDRFENGVSGRWLSIVLSHFFALFFALDCLCD